MNRQKTFGDELQHFILSIDIVDNQVKNDLLGMIREYLKSSLEIVFIIFHTETIVNGELGLKTSEWLPVDRNLSVNIKHSDGKYSSQVTLSYDTANPLWIHGKEHALLSKSESYIDEWSNTNPSIIPKYIKNTDWKNKTSIIVPIRDINRPRLIGVINLESESLIEFSEYIAAEIVKIANSIAILYALNGTFVTQNSNSKKEVANLGKIASNGVNIIKIMSRPRVFFAFSSKSKDDVIDLVIDILDTLKSKGIIDYIDWRDEFETGVVITQIAKEINSCLFGICYFSEPSKSGGYLDNPNVLFEAGLVSAKCTDSSFDNLIPIREKLTEIPFDLSGIRLLKVDRNKEGTLNEDKFKRQLENRIHSLLKSSGIKL